MEPEWLTLRIVISRISQGKNQNIETVESAVFQDHKELKEQVNILAALELQYQGNGSEAEVLRANNHFLASGVGGDLQGSASLGGRGNYQSRDVEVGEGAMVSEGAMVGLKYISGIVQLAQRHAFQRQIFLITRGNSYVLFNEIEETEEASTYMVLYLGDRFGSQLRRLL